MAMYFLLGWTLIVYIGQRKCIASDFFSDTCDVSWQKKKTPFGTYGNGSNAMSSFHLNPSIFSAHNVQKLQRVSHSNDNCEVIDKMDIVSLEALETKRMKECRIRERWCKGHCTSWWCFSFQSWSNCLLCWWHNGHLLVLMFRSWWYEPGTIIFLWRTHIGWEWLVFLGFIFALQEAPKFIKLITRIPVKNGQSVALLNQGQISQ